jgi:putative Ca2+/H+ antiporter (TMEM165/GDT1 family)
MRAVDNVLEQEITRINVGKISNNTYRTESQSSFVLFGTIMDLEAKQREGETARGRKLTSNMEILQQYFIRIQTVESVTVDHNIS